MTTTTTTIAVCAAVALTATCPARAATARDSKFQPNAEATVRYLQNAQRENGSFAEPGSEPNPEFSAWVALALAAAGINPRDQTTAKQHYQAGHSAYTYLVEHAHQASPTTDFERELLVVDAAGTQPHDFGGVDLVGEILGRQIATGGGAGAFAHETGSRTAEINDTIFAILSLSPVPEPAVQEAIGRAAQWLEAEQNCDGSWNSVHPRTVRSCGSERGLLSGEGTGEVDMTGAALQALNAAKRPDPRGQEWAFTYLRKAEARDGGFPELLGGEPNVASTAWVVQAMWSAGINPETWSTGLGLASDEPLGYLASMQQEDGHIRYEASRELNGMWMTAYVAPALFGDAQPIPKTPYEPLPALPPEEPAGGGDGGVSTNSGGGVIAGGGGDGAPLVSRPQLASRGHTPGGARQLKSQKHDRPRTYRRNPGPARREIVPTITAADASGTRARQGTGAARRGAALIAADAAQTTGATGGTEVRGVPIDAPGALDSSDLLEAGAPGLRSAGAGDDREQWPTIATYAAITLLVLAGALIEYRRPRTAL